jgi:hypothetical protein
MNAMTLLACGMVVSLFGETALGQARPPAAGFDMHAGAQGGPPAQPSWARAKEITPPAPRGDLRGDIASNARSRPDADRDSKNQHH